MSDRLTDPQSDRQTRRVLVYSQGIEAYRTGQEIGDNPFSDGDLSEWWEMGYKFGIEIDQRDEGWTRLAENQ